MANVLDVPYGQIGDASRKHPTAIAVETLAAPQPKPKENPGAAKSHDRNVGAGVGTTNTTTYAQAKRVAVLRSTTGSDGRRNNGPRIPVVQDTNRDGPVVVNDEIYARWESKPLPRGTTLKQALAEVVSANTRDPKEPIMRIKIKFSDASEVTFARTNVSSAASLKFQDYFNPHDVEDEAYGKANSQGGVAGVGVDGCLTRSSAKSHDSRTRRLPQHPNMKDLEMPTPVQLKEMFKAMDYNGNGLLSLAEVDNAIKTTWPHFNNKAVLIRAFKAADANGSGWVGRLEFEFLIRFIINFTKCFRVFSKVDMSGDNRIDFAEFAAGAREVGLPAADKPQQLREDFRKIDKNGGGLILFEEFCHYLAAQQADLHLALNNGERASILSRRTQANSRSIVNGRPTGGKVEPIPSLDKLKAAEYFDRADVNGNGKLSLAELDKVIVELWPRFNLKPAIMRAYKACDKNGSGFVGRGEFKLFLDYIVTFNNLWAAFRALDTNSDRRVSRQEFCTGAKVLDVCSESDALPIFMAIDHNGGGYVLFEEYCMWMTEKKLGINIMTTKATISKQSPPASTKTKVVAPSSQPANHLGVPYNVSRAAAAQQKLQIASPDPKKAAEYFSRADVNGNGKLSLAELDKVIVELWPRFNLKPAIMRAYKACDKNGSGFVGRGEFKLFLDYIVTFNNLWQQFAAADTNNDRRLTKAEFLQFARQCSIMPSSTSDEELMVIFNAADTNDGGCILFDEFCAVLCDIRLGTNST